MSFFTNLNIANQLTLLRIILVPIMIALLYFDKTWSNITATVIFSIASITDWVDGYIARKYNMITDMGKILDPVADKIIVAAAMVVLAELGRLSGVIVVVLLSRDFAVGALRNLASSKGVIIAAGMSGKVKTALQMVGLGCVIYKDMLLGLDILLIGQIIMYGSVAVSVYSGVEYFKGFVKADV